VKSDALLLEQVLGNLVANALRWTAQGGVLVAARRRGPTVHLEVWDTGVGISASDQARIFEDFVQLDNGQRDRRKGLGLGLAIARRSARLIGSDISLASRPGLGSRFGLVQPAVPAPQVAVGRSPVDPHAITAIARDPALPLLVVEDDAIVGAALRELLGRWGVAADVVGDGATAIAAIDAGMRYGLVLSDYRLGPKENGVDLIRDIASRHPAPVPAAVMITGDFSADVVVVAHANGIPLLHKPVRPSDLMRLLGIERR
jgi:CheY-like chemotaxis protein